MLSSWLLMPISKAINHYIKLDPESPQHLDSLKDNSIAITIKEIATTFFVNFKATGIVLTDTPPQVIHTTIKASGFTFLQLLKNPQHLQQDLEITGDLELGQQVKQFLTKIHIDWQEILSYYLGDYLSYGVTSGFKNFTHWLAERKQALTENIDEYLHHELKITPTSIEIENFHQGVRNLRDATDRLTLKIKDYKEKH